MSDEPGPYLVDKPLGATPLQALDMLRRVRPELGDQKLSYAGRLDPMASGLLVVAHGPWLMRQEELWGLPKQYNATVLLGLTTDSYDLLGMVSPGPILEIPHQRMTTAAQTMVGKMALSIPVFSSYRSGGKPMFQWARQGVPADVSVPVRRMSVAEVQVTGIGEMSTAALSALVHERIPLVQGDFRQQEILSQWDRMLAGAELSRPTVCLQISCGSGTYIRSLAHELGRRLGSGGILTDLRRLRVGPYSLDDAIVLY